MQDAFHSCFLLSIFLIHIIFLPEIFTEIRLYFTEYPIFIYLKTSNGRADQEIFK